MISCIIVDDEKAGREFLVKLIEKYFKDKLVVLETVDNLSSAVNAINTHRPELVFLDIELQGEDGFQLFRYFDSVFFDIIFTTAYQHYAISAIKYAAIDYLLKPLNYIDIHEAIKRLERKRSLLTNQIRITALLENINSGSVEFQKIALPTSTGYELEKFSNILYCEGSDNYSKIHTVSGRSILVSKTLKSMETLLPSECFVRIHKSSIVNLNHVVSYSRVDGYSVTLNNGVKLDVSYRKNEEFIQKLLKKDKK
jgi:two-component system LytT family response regulator